jgi:hypothetical protein
MRWHPVVNVLDYSTTMDLKYAQIRSQHLRIAHYNLVCSALYSKIRRFACVFMRILEPWVLPWESRCQRLRLQNSKSREYKNAWITHLKYAQIRSQSQCISHYNLVWYALQSEMRRICRRICAYFGSFKPVTCTTGCYLVEESASFLAEPLLQTAISKWIQENLRLNVKKLTRPDQKKNSSIR